MEGSPRGKQKAEREIKRTKKRKERPEVGNSKGSQSCILSSLHLQWKDSLELY